VGGDPRETGLVSGLLATAPPSTSAPPRPLPPRGGKDLVPEAMSETHAPPLAPACSAGPFIPGAASGVGPLPTRARRIPRVACAGDWTIPHRDRGDHRWGVYCRLGGGVGGRVHRVVPGGSDCGRGGDVGEEHRIPAGTGGCLGGCPPAPLVRRFRRCGLPADSCIGPAARVGFQQHTEGVSPAGICRAGVATCYPGCLVSPTL